MHPRAAGRGAAAALAGLGAAELLTALVDRPSLLDAVARVVVDTAPRAVVDRVVTTVGAADKALTRAGVAGGVLLAGVAAAGAPAARGTAVALATALGAAATARRPARAPVAGAGAAALGGVVGLRALSARHPGAAAGLGGAALALGCGRRVLRRRRFAAGARRAPLPLAAGAPTDGAETWGECSPLSTPPERFLATDVALGTPLVDGDAWRLRIGGSVAREVELSRADLLALGTEDVDAVLVCIHNPPGGPRVGNGRWTGVPLRRVLDLVGPLPGATALVSRSADGVDMSWPLEVLDELGGSVVLGLGGAPLRPEHGHPARLLVPGLYGQYAGVKWLTELRLVEDRPADYWVRRGWPAGPVRVRPQARIDAPAAGPCPAGAVAVRGVAWAPPHGLRGVEVSVDGGPWRPAELARELSGTSWRRWRASVELPPGPHDVRARAVPRTGPPQTGEPAPPFPAGTAGLHTLRLVARAVPGGRRG
ncbi:molybdopterin-dependent oxidoreductase [Geodermatophilus sp. SYSU D01186]